MLKISRILKHFLRSIIDSHFLKETTFFFKTYTVKNSSLEEDENIKENIIKDVRNHFKLKKIKKETNDTAAQDIRNLFRLKKENKVIKDRILRDIRNLFDHGDTRNIFTVKKNNKAIKDRIIK